MSRADAVRIVICEDSLSYAHALRLFLERDDDLSVVAVCESAEDLLARLPRLHPDLVTMDLELPGIDGVAAIERIMNVDPRPILVVSAHGERGSERAAAALTAGALDALHKREIRFDDPDRPAAIALRRRVKRLAVTRLRRRSPSVVGDCVAASLHGAVRVRGCSAAVIAIGSSTGGPAALAELLGPLPADFPVPVLVAQHLSPGFTDGLARWLDGLVPVPVDVAREGQAAGRGVWFAPSDAHLELLPDMTLCVSSRAAGRHRPSVDLLLRSVAHSAGSAAVGVVLTGMGSDGAEGIAAVRSSAGLTIAQDAGSSAVNGMPAAAIRGGAEVVLTPAQIGAALATVVRARRVAT